MPKKIIVVTFFIFIVTFLFAVQAHSEIALSPSAGKIDISVGTKTGVLKDEIPSGELTDSNGGTAKFKYDSKTEAVDVLAASGSPTLTYLIAKIFLDEGESINIVPNQNYKGGVFVNTSEKEDAKITIVFLDGSKVELPPGASISLTYLADGSYHLKVLEGSVEFTDPNGAKRIITSRDPVILEKGFTKVPGWRSTDIVRNPATP